MEVVIIGGSVELPMWFTDALFCANLYSIHGKGRFV